MQSHLTKLIKRVREVPKSMRHEPIFTAKLINLAEYLIYEEDYTEFEERKATALLKAFDLHGLLVLPALKFEEEVKEFEKQTCMICSRTIQIVDKKFGMCRGCRDLRKKGFEEDLSKWKDTAKA